MTPNHPTTASPTIAATIAAGRATNRRVQLVGATSTANTTPAHGTPNTDPKPPANAAISRPWRTCRTEMQPLADAVGEAGGHLQRRPLAAGRPAEEVGRQRAAEDERGHPQRHAVLELGDLGHRQAGAHRGTAAEPEVDEPGRDADNGRNQISHSWRSRTSVTKSSASRNTALERPHSTPTTIAATASRSERVTRSASCSAPPVHRTGAAPHPADHDDDRGEDQAQPGEPNQTHTSESASDAVTEIDRPRSSSASA